MSSSKQMFCLDPFCARQFDDATYTGTRIDWDKEDFVARVSQAHAAGAPLVDGYAPFCKHIFIPSFIPAVLPYLAVTHHNEHLLRSAYEARTEAELPVLSRWFPADSVPDPPPATHLDIILYSREQLRKEAEAMGRTDEQSEHPWGIISAKAQDVAYELPMQPITMMRNALGADEGGSGVPLEREKYMTSVGFWSNHAPIKSAITN